jgi:hypothetical protein
MSKFITEFLHSALSALFLLGLSIFPLRTASSEAQVANQIDDIVRLAPFMITIPQDASNKLVFIWSKDCQDCPSVFREFVWPIITAPAQRKTTAVSIVQYEERPQEIKNIVKLLCAKHNAYVVYSSASLHHLLRDTPDGDRFITVPKDVKVLDSLKVASQLCKDRTKATQIVTEFMKNIKTMQNVTKLPVIEYNGTIVSPPYNVLKGLQ